MKSKLAFLVIFSCFLQICYGDKDDVSNDTDEIHRKKVGEPCKVCEEVVDNVISLRRSNGSRGDMYDYITDLCLNYTNYGSKACRGMMDIKLDTALYIIDNKENLTAARFCSINFQSYGCKDPNAESWSIPLPPLSSGINTQISDKNVTTVAHILHVTDIHYDPLYKWNSNAHCKQPLCCESGSASTSNEAAGYWGDYHVCDTPWSVIENLFSRLGGWHRRTIDWMYFTGDIVDHRSWATSVKHNSDSITKILKLFYTTFPNKTLYPILGNHESHPADFFAPDSISKNLNISTQWLYDLAAKEWLRWLPDTTEATIKKGGFYTVLVKPGFRIIALNSNVCYVENIWLVYDDKDPYGQLQWLVDVLTEAEKNGEKVHILSHVPPGEISCHRQWSHEFKQIVLRTNVTTVAHILHVTDIHYDPLYKWNSNAHCKQPLCCESGSASTSNEAAGYWGDYHVCDTPWSVIENLFSRLGGWHRRTIDWMYFTGDIVDHRSWATSVKHNSDSITKILKLFYTTFPNKTLYPILGNHESHPADFFAPDSISKNLNISTQWLYDLAAKEWLRWLPDTTEATIKKGGFYTVLVKPGFRIIALNSNVCYVENIWLVYDDKDPYGQLQWLVDVLTEAEKNGEKVHILSHVPPGEISCHRQWSHEFKQIVLRFSDTIIAQFNGHTHTDEFKLFFNSSSQEVKGVAFNGGSLTSYIGLNPNYRIYEINNETMAVTNYEQYTFNLSVANLDSQIEPAWNKLYTIKGAYALPDLELETLGDFFWQMAMNNSVKHLVKKYYSFMSRNSDMYSQQKCNEACRKKLVCRIAATDTDETLKC